MPKHGKPFDVREVLGFCLVQKAGPVPSLVSIFFQHPWGLALPLAFATILVVTAREHQRLWVRYGVLVVLLSALSFSEVVMFLAMAPTVVAVEAWHVLGHEWHDEKPKARALLGVVAMATAVLGIAFAMGGFFAPNPAAGRPSPFYLKWGVLNGFGPSLHWFFQSFGFVGPLGIFGLVLLPRRARLFAALLMGGSLFVISVVHHSHSGDDLTWKFGTVASVVMGLSASRIVTRVWPIAESISVGKRVARIGLAGIMMTASMAAGLSYVSLFSLFPSRAGKIFVPSSRNITPDDFAAATYLRREMKPGELVFRREDVPSHRYAQWAGLSVPWTDWATPAFGFSPTLLRDRIKLLQVLPPEPNGYLAQGIRWFVLEPADTKLLGHANTWIADGKAHEVRRFGSLRVIKLDIGDSDQAGTN